MTRPVWRALARRLAALALAVFLALAAALPAAAEEPMQALRQQLNDLYSGTTVSSFSGGDAAAAAEQARALQREIERQAGADAAGWGDRAYAAVLAGRLIANAPGGADERDALYLDFCAGFFAEYAALTAPAAAAAALEADAWSFCQLFYDTAALLAGRGQWEQGSALYDWLQAGAEPWTAAWRDEYAARFDTADGAQRLACIFGAGAQMPLALDGDAARAQPAALDRHGHYRADLLPLLDALGWPYAQADGVLTIRMAGDTARRIDLESGVMEAVGDGLFFPLDLSETGAAGELRLTLCDLETLFGTMALRLDADAACWVLEDDTWFMGTALNFTRENWPAYQALIGDLTLQNTAGLAAELTGLAPSDPDALALLRPLSGLARSAEAQALFAAALQEAEGLPDAEALGQAIANAAQRLVWAFQAEGQDYDPAAFAGYAARTAWLTQLEHAAGHTRTAVAAARLAGVCQLLAARFETAADYRAALQAAGAAPAAAVAAAQAQRDPLTERHWAALRAEAAGGTAAVADLCAQNNLLPAPELQALPEWVDPATRLSLLTAGAALRAALAVLALGLAAGAAWRWRHGRMIFGRGRRGILRRAGRSARRLQALCAQQADLPPQQTAPLRALAQSARGIWQTVRFKPDTWPAARRFLQLYLPAAARLLCAWQAEGTLWSRHAADTATLAEAFARQLDALYGAQAIEIEAELSAMLAMMQADSLLADELQRMRRAAR